jgi:hypothetical protein
VSIVLGQHQCADTDLAVLLGGEALQPGRIPRCPAALRGARQSGLSKLIRRINTQRFVSI